MPSIAFWTGAALNIGGGHVMRCLTLADELASRGCEVVFLVRPRTPIFVPKLVQSGFRISEVEGTDDAACAALAKIAPAGRVDLLAIDDYAIGLNSERAMRKVSTRIMAIDDFVTRTHECDLLLNQTFGLMEQDCRNAVYGGPTLLVGSRYALVRREFAEARERSLARRNGAANGHVAISIGLTDHKQLSVPIARELSERLPATTVDIILGPTAPSIADARRLAAERASVRLHVDPTDIAHLFTAADVAIGTAGSSTWERCCLGLPSVLIVVAENQRTIAINVCTAGAALAAEKLDPACIASQAADLFRERCQQRRMGSAAAAICDGRGAQRVADAIFACLHSPGAAKLNLRSGDPG